MTAVLLPDTFQPNTVPARSAEEGAVVGGHRLDAAIYRRRRLVVLAVALGMILGLLSFGRQADASPDPAVVVTEALVVVVQPGDTLWSIARTMQPEGDHRALVSALSAMVEGSVLLPGQRLVVPAGLLG